MLKKRMAAGVVALAMMSTLGLSACSNGSDSSSNSASSGSASGSIPKPDVSCDIPATNLDDSKIDTSKVEGEITFQTQGLKTDFGDFFTKKIKEFEDANPGVKIKWTDQAGGAEFDQTITAQATNCQMADVVNVPSSTILALSKSNLLMDFDVKAPGIGDKFVQTIWDSTKLGANKHHTALPWYFGPYITTYNKEVFKRAGLDENTSPKTMEEMFDYAAKVGADGKGDYGIYGSPQWYMTAQLHGMGVNLMNADKTEFNFADNEQAIKYVTRLAELYKSGAIPKEYIGPIDEGIQEAAKSGILGGYPVLGVKATVYDGSYHEVDSSEMAFHIAGSLAFKDAMNKGGAVLLEPIMKVEVTIPEDYMGFVVGDINSRRGRVEGFEDISGGKMIKAFVPLSEMFGYSTDLRSGTQGRGNYSMFFEKYEQVPKNIADKVLNDKK